MGRPIQIDVKLVAKAQRAVKTTRDLDSFRSALAERVGHPVKASVLWRLLARHGWRKVAPDTRHPKNDPRIMKAWKKNSRKRWQPCSDRAW